MDRMSADYIESMSIPVTDTGCWLWTGRRDPCGYGKIFIGGREYGAHRISYSAFNNETLGPYHVIHSCDTPCCVNPYHLRKSDHSGNMRDKALKGRASRLKGERHPNSKLSDAQVIEVFKSKDGSASLAKKYGVNRHAIWSIRTGKSWNHITRNINE